MSAPPCVERVEFEDYHLHFRLTSGRVKSGELTILCNLVSLVESVPICRNEWKTLSFEVADSLNC